MIKIMERLDPNELVRCPLCGGNIVSRIAEITTIKYDTRGNICSDLDTILEDKYVCSKCGQDVSSMFKENRDGTISLYSDGRDIIARSKNIKKLAKEYNPFTE